MSKIKEIQDELNEAERKIRRAKKVVQRLARNKEWWDDDTIRMQNEALHALDNANDEFDALYAQLTSHGTTARRNPAIRPHGATTLPSSSTRDSLISLGVGVAALGIMAFVTRGS